MAYWQHRRVCTSHFLLIEVVRSRISSLPPGLEERDLRERGISIFTKRRNRTDRRPNASRIPGQGAMLFCFLECGWKPRIWIPDDMMMMIVITSTI